MPITSLRTTIESHRLNPTIIAETGDWPCRDLLRFSRCSPIGRDGHGHDVALRFHDPARLALALLALDGVARRIFLVSADLQESDAKKLIGDFEPTLTISDDPTLDLPNHSHRLWDAKLPDAEHGIEHDHQTDWTLATSGTTGMPKLIGHSLTSLMRTTKIGNERTWRWGQLFDMCRFAGVQVFLQGLLGGTALLLPPPSWSLDKRLTFLRENDCEALSATPTLWRKILMTIGASPWPLRQITLGGEIADASTLKALEARFPKTRIAHVYASTEAGVGFSVTDGLPGFPLSYLTTPDRAHMKLVDGRLFLASHGMRFPSSSQLPVDADGFIDTGDVVQIVGDRCLFLGRANGAINVGGNKLFPEEVESVLLELEEISLARVFAKSNPIMGQIVVAEIVLKDRTCEPRSIRQLATSHCAERLERWKVPAMLQIKDSLENNASGKLNRTLR